MNDEDTKDRVSSLAFSQYLLLLQMGPAVLRSVPVLAINLDDPEMKIIFVSYLLEAMFGYEEGELREKSIDMLLMPEHVKVHHQHFEKFQKHPEDRTMNAGIWVPGKKKDGSLIMVQVSLCVQEVGRQKCVIAHIVDVTKAFDHFSTIEQLKHKAETKA